MHETSSLSGCLSTKGFKVFFRQLLRDQRVIDLVTKSLVNVADNTYIAGQSDFVDGTSCDVLYIPRSADMNSLPPIVLEIQRTVNDKFMSVPSDTARQSLKHMANCRFLSFCVSDVNSSTMTKFSASRDLFFAREAHCDFWAKRCILLSKTTLDGHVIE